MTTPLPVLLVCAAFTVTASASTGAVPQSLPARQSQIEVTPQGAFLRESLGSAPRSVNTGSLALTAPGLTWSHPDNGSAWIATAVAIGERGSQVFAEYDLNNEAAELLSAFDSDPPTPVWTDGSPLGTEFRVVASADENDVHVVVDQVVLNNNIQTRQAVVRKYSSVSATPLWSYTFTPIINAGSNVGIARDGQTIVAAIYNNNTSEVEIATWGPNSGTPSAYTKVAVGANNFMRGFDLSADGSTLYFSAGIQAYVFDLATQTVVFNTNIGASFDSHAISGDGSVFAFGNFNALSVWERSGGTYSNTHTVTKPGQVFCAEIDISDDSSTVAAGWYYYNPGLQVTLEALDAPSKTITMTQTLLGVGGLQNLVSDVSCSANGDRFAVGLWGDAGTIDEVRLYNSNSATPAVTFNTPGSVFDIDLSADGQRVVAGSKAVHANTLGNGGRVDLVDAGGEDLVLRGTPSLGATVEYQLYGTVGKPALLMTSLALQQPPISYTGIGTLYIDRATLTFESMGTVLPQGFAQHFVTLGSDPALVGKSFFHQGLLLGPRTLSQDWLKMTVLP
jgi:WD40 repeat protein